MLLSEVSAPHGLKYLGKPKRVFICQVYSFYYLGHNAHLKHVLSIQYSVLWLSYFANDGLLDRVRVPIEPKSGHSILDFFVFTYLSLQIIYFKIDALFVKTDCHLIYLFPHRKFRNISLNHRFMKRKNLQMILMLMYPKIYPTYKTYFFGLLIVKAMWLSYIV